MPSVDEQTRAFLQDSSRSKGMQGLNEYSTCATSGSEAMQCRNDLNIKLEILIYESATVGYLRRKDGQQKTPGVGSFCTNLHVYTKYYQV